VVGVTGKAKKSAAGDGLLKKLVLGILGFLLFYVVWCWFALLRWGVTPPVDPLAVCAAGGLEMVATGAITVAKTLKKSDNTSADELKRLKKENAELRKQITKIQAAVGGEQIKMGE
jgi:hypothetical protein